MGNPRLSRLTEPQREVLRRWQHRQSAKEIALELGISHWAVVGRLRTARHALGAPTSNDAARMLAEAERDGTYTRVVYTPEPLAESYDSGIVEGSGGQGNGQHTRTEEAREVREERVPFEVQAPLLAGFRLPAPRYPGDRNDLSVARRLFWIGALALGIVLGVGALISTSWGVVRLMGQIVRALP